MNNQDGKNFMWLNREGSWQGSSWSGLEIGPTGALRLHSVPAFDGQLPQAIAGLPAPDGPAGIAVDLDGTIYFSDPSNNRILRIDGCDSTLAPVPCLEAAKTPRGLVIDPARAALFIVESLGHDIRVVRTTNCQSLERWKNLDTPWTIARGDAGSFYVVDYGNRSVQKFNALGELQTSFWSNLSAGGVLTQPVDVAAGNAQVFIADQASHAIVAADSNGKFLGSFGADQLQLPMGMAVTGGVLYVGDNARQQVLAFDAATRTFIGEAAGYQGPVAALAPDHTGGLLVHTGTSLAPVRLVLGQGFVKQGVFWTGAIAAPADKVLWHRLAAVLTGNVDTLPSGAHVQFFIHTSASVLDAPAPPVLDPGQTDPFTDTRWLAQPPDVNDLFIGGTPTHYLWIGAWFSGNGQATVSIEQMRVEFDHSTYIENLPAIYRKPGACRDFLLRLLSLFESFNLETEDAINRLPSLFDPRSAPPDYLPWLAGWLALQLEEDWDEATARRAIAQAFARSGQRGTAAGLRRALKDEAGVDAIIQEPILSAGWWSLPVPQKSCSGAASTGETVWQMGENSVLGYTTMLAPAQAQGAVVGSTAVLDQSHLIADTDFGAPLFGDVAFQFTVQVYQGQVSCASARDLVCAVIEREKPAHTGYHLCVLEPRMRVGLQARVGVDTIVSGPHASLRLGETPDLGSQTLLGGRQPGRIGGQLQLGVSTSLG